MIPVARELMSRGYNIIIGSGEEHLALFREEFPNINCIYFPGFRTGYSRFLPQYFYMLLKLPLLIYHSAKEHRMLKKIILDNDIDIVISDNRFGLWNNDITSVYVTHMPRIPFPRLSKPLEFIGVLLHRAVIKKYTLCLIPDVPGSENLSGRLSHNIRHPGNVRFTGILSRFMHGDNEMIPYPGMHNTVILSGPEPQRTMLKNKLIAVLGDNREKSVFFEGKPHLLSREKHESGNMIFYNHLPARLMKRVVTGSKNIICRPGYSTLMDLVTINCSALVIPTPGQTEQEYLARYLTRKGWFSSVSQRKIDKCTSLPPTSPQWPASIITESRILLYKALEEISDCHHKEK